MRLFQDGRYLFLRGINFQRCLLIKTASLLDTGLLGGQFPLPDQQVIFLQECFMDVPQFLVQAVQRALILRPEGLPRPDLHAAQAHIRSRLGRSAQGRTQLFLNFPDGRPRPGCRFLIPFGD